MDNQIVDFLEYHRQHPEYTFLFGVPVKDQTRVYCANTLAGLPLELTAIAPYRRGGRMRQNLNQTMTHSQCAECLRVLRNDMFHNPPSFRAKNSVSSYCLECVKARHAKYYRETAHGLHIQRNYKITKTEYNELLTQQHGACAICGVIGDTKSKNGKTVHLSVDHHHETGEVRGLLCGNCNRAIGLFGEDIEIMRQAIEYLLSFG